MGDAVIVNLSPRLLSTARTCNCSGIFAGPCGSGCRSHIGSSCIFCSFLVGCGASETITALAVDLDSHRQSTPAWPVRIEYGHPFSGPFQTHQIGAGSPRSL